MVFNATFNNIQLYRGCDLVKKSLDNFTANYKKFLSYYYIKILPILWKKKYMLFSLHFAWYGNFGIP